jgi:hypothetical protein
MGFFLTEMANSAQEKFQKTRKRAERFIRNMRQATI